jgi:PAS domain S-box-containing protein
MTMDPKKNLVDGRYTIRDLVDLKKLRGIFQHFTNTMGFTIGFLSVPDMEILIATGWRDICTKFHRKCPRAAENCRRSNVCLTRKMTRPGKVVMEKCANGLVDCAMPVFIKGKRVAILATGQVLLEAPDLARFRRQAKAFGCHEKKYMAALADVPVVSSKRLKQVTGLLKDLASLVAELGYAGLKEKEKTEDLARDVDARKKTENALKETAGQLQALFGAVPDGVLVAEARTQKILKANPGICRMFGHSENEFLGKKICDLHPHVRFKEILENFRQLAQGRRSAVVDVPCLKKDGSAFFVDITARLLIFQGKRCLVGFFRDTTKRKLAEERLRDNEERLRSLYVNMNEGLALHEVIYDGRGKAVDYRILFANKAYEKHTGFKARRVLGKRASAVYGMKKPPFLEGYAKVAAGGVPFSFDSYFSPLKRHFHISVFSPQRGQFATVFSDITERKISEKKLRESEAQFRNLFESSKDALMTLEAPSWKFTSANTSMVRMFKAKSKAELFLHSPWKLSPPRQPDGCASAGKSRRMIRMAIRRGAHFFEWEHRRLDGTTFPAEVLLNKVKKDGGMFLQATVRDITDRKKSEHDLAASETRYRRLFECAKDGVLILNAATGMIEDVNPFLIRMLGYSHKAFLGKKLWEVGAFKDAKKCRIMFRELQKKKYVRYDDMPLETADGRKISVEFVSNVYRVDGQLVIQCNVRDVTERKLAAEALKESKTNLDIALQAARMGVWQFNLAENKRYFDSQVCNLLGIDPKSFSGKAVEFFRAVHPEDREIIKKELARCIKTGVLYEPEYRVIWPDKSVHCVAVRGMLVRDSGGFPWRLNGVIWDVTERKRAEKALKESEERFRLVVNNSQDTVYRRNIQTGKYDFFSAAVTKMTGFSPKELTGKDIGFVTCRVHPDDLVRTQPVLDRVKSGVLKSGIIEYRFRHKNGSYRWLSDRFSILEDSNKTPLYWVGVSRDVTDRKRADEALCASEERLQLQFRRMPIACILWSTDFRVISWNPAAKKVFGYTAREAYGKHPYDLIVPKSIQGIARPLWRRLLKGDATANLINDNVTKQGKTILCKWTNTPLRESGGEIVGVLSMAEDITELKKAEDALIDGQRQLRQIIDTVPHMIFAKDRQGRFLLVNRAVGAMYGKEPHELIGKKRLEVHPVPQEMAKFIEVDREVLATGKPRLISNEPFTDVNGRHHILQTIKIPFKMAGLEDEVILGVSVDVTEQRKVEEFRNDIVRTVSHELRTPLSIEKEGISLLMDGVVGPVSAEQKEILETVMRSIDRLARMITSLLDISSIETGKIQLLEKMTNLADLVKDVVFEFKKRAGEKRLDLRVNLPGSEVPVLADPDKITQVLSNLVDNAIKFTPEGGTVDLSVTVLEDVAECEVRDTGIGIAPENIAKAFEKFQQFSRTAGPGEKGFGLGLSIVKGIIASHGGKVWLTSELGKGTQVTFTLPFHPRKGG